MLCEVPIASSSSAGGAPVGKPKRSSCPPDQSSEELIQSLLDQLDERSREIKGLDAKLRGLQSESQSISDRENFVMAELATQVHDLDCKLFPVVVPLYPVYSCILGFSFCRYSGQRC